MCHRKSYLLTKDKIYDTIDTEPETEQRNICNTTGMLVNISVASCIQDRQNRNASVQSWLHKDWQILDLRCYLSSLLKKEALLLFFIYQMDEKSETTAAFLSLCMSGQEIRRVNLI